MTLRLRVVSDHRRLLGDRASVAFSEAGAAIGRSADNDWVLPDPLRYVSAHHARVEFRGGHYFLQDLSTNGVFMNDEEQALSKAHPGGYRLKTGDVVRMGDYHILVSVEDSQEVPAAESGENAAAVPTSIHGLRTLGRASQTDIGAMLDLDDLLLPETSESDIQPVNAYGQAVAARGSGPAALARKPEPVAEPEPDEEAVARRIARLARAAGRDPRSGASAPALYDVQSGLQAFCRGAGIDPDELPADAQTRMLHLAGQLLREAFVGFKELERARHEARNRFRVELPVDADDPRPSLPRLTVDELLSELLLQHESRRLDAVQWLRESVADAKAHEAASAQATRTALIEFLDRLDPAELEARFERAARRGKAKSADKAQYWELFTTFYRNLIEMPADQLPHTFVEAFAAAYREQVKKPSA